MSIRPRMVIYATVLTTILGSLLLSPMNGSRATSPATIGLKSVAQDTVVPESLQSSPAQVQIPPNLETPQAIQVGAPLFRENCVPCHGAPGIGPVVQGLTPAPPNLLAAGRRNDPAEVFSKIKNGIAGTAMPAFRNSLPDQAIWSLAAFLHSSRGISADAFNALSGPEADAGHENGQSGTQNH
jgi:mono/diheme cytochrome c family protein